MPKSRVLSGKDVVTILEKFGFQIHSQKGSHIKMRGSWEAIEKTVVVPNHTEIDRGTLRSIYKKIVGDPNKKSPLFTEFFIEK